MGGDRAKRRFGVFILTHGRPEKVLTYPAIRRAGYTGPIFLVVDDEDETEPQYREKYGDEVIVFSKRKVAEKFDPADNFDDRRAVFYARNACFDLAERLGITHFMQLDDHYTGWYHRFDSRRKLGCWPMRGISTVLDAMCDILDTTPTLTIAFAQGGDYIGGSGNSVLSSIGVKRKAMNTFVCKTKNRFQFYGRVNEDVSTYVELGRRGNLIMSLMSVQIVQPATQSSPGGMTEMYLDSGTYVKSFYSVCRSPSCVRVAMMGDKHRRWHHRVDWKSAGAKVLSRECRKGVR